MEYRGIEYQIAQGIERGTWVWSLRLPNGVTKSGSERGKEFAVQRVKLAINAALAQKRPRPVSSLEG